MNPFDILKNAQRLQEQMGELQEKLGGITVTGYAGGGMAQVEMNGKMEVLAVHLDPELITAGEVEVLEVIDSFSSIPGAPDDLRISLTHESSGYVTFEVVGETDSTYVVEAMASLKVEASGFYEGTGTAVPDGRYSAAEYDAAPKESRTIALEGSIRLACCAEFTLVLDKATLAVSRADVALKAAQEAALSIKGTPSIECSQGEDGGTVIDVARQDISVRSYGFLDLAFQLAFEPAIGLFETASYPSFLTRATLSDGTVSGSIGLEAEPEGLLGDGLIEYPIDLATTDLLGSFVQDGRIANFSEEVALRLPVAIEADQGRVSRASFAVSSVWAALCPIPDLSFAQALLPPTATMTERGFDDAKDEILAASAYQAALADGGSDNKAAVPTVPGAEDEGSDGLPWAHLAAVAAVAALAAALLVVIRKGRSPPG